MEALIAAGASITVGVLSLVGVIITNSNSNRKIEHLCNDRNHKRKHANNCNNQCNVLNK